MTSTPAWRKSTRSNGGSGQCVEVTAIFGSIAVRDSKNPTGAVLAFGRTAWAAFAQGLKER